MPKAKRHHLGFKLSGIEPSHDLAWHFAGEKGHRSFWREAAKIGLQVKDRSLARGLGADGNPLADISQYTREHRRSAMGRARASAPPLTPARRLSRTRSYLRAFVEHDSVWYAWRHDHRTGASWGVILSYQKGQGRDVFGFSPADMAEITRRMLAWWRRYRVRYAMAGSVSTGRVLDVPALIGPQPPALARPPVAAGLRDLAGLSGADKRQVREAAARGTFSGARREVGPATSGPFVRKAK